MVSKLIDRILDGFTGCQKEAVVTEECNCLVVGAPGTGKTKVLTTRIAYLLVVKDIKPEDIIVFTFTNKAAYEMRTNISRMIKADLNNLFCGTFYNCFAKLLRDDCSVLGYDRFFSIYDSVDSKILLGNIIKTQHLDEDKYKIDDIAAKISTCKSSLITYDDYNKNDKFLQEDKSNGIKSFGKIYMHYCVACKKNNAMDFDDILLNTYSLLKNNIKIRNKYQAMFKYIFVDEFQDTSKIQYELVKMLTDKYNNIYVVGDDSQRFCSTGSDTVSHIINFERKFKKCKTFRLELSYRSAERITNIANSIRAHDKTIDHNDIAPKQGNKLHNQGEVDIIKTLTPTEEARSVALFIESVVKEKKIKYSDIAVLYRIDSQAILLENAFNYAEIKYKRYHATSLLQKPIIKSIIGYLRVIVNNHDDEGVKLSINEPRRGLGGGILEKIYNVVEKERISLWEAFTAKNNVFDKKIKDLLVKYVKVINDVMKIVTTQNAYNVVSSLLEDIGILEKLKKGKTEKDKYNYEDVVYFLNIAKAFIDDVSNADKSLHAFLQYITFNDYSICDDLVDAVSIMPVQASKGLEFKCVCIFGLNDGLFPLINNDNIVDINAEHRLFYIAVTRSRDILVLSLSDNIDKNGVLEAASQSRFLKEIGREYFGEKNMKTLDAIKEKSSKLTKDYAKYSIFNYSIISKRSKHKKGVTYVSPDLLVSGKRFHYSQYGWGVVTGKGTYGGMTVIKVEFEECGVHEVVYDPSKIFVCS